MRLRALLQAATPESRERLATTLGMAPDPASRLSELEKLERAWFRRPFDERSLHEDEKWVLRLLTAERAGVTAAELPEAAAGLVDRGWLLRDAEGRLHVPDALRLCLASTPTDPPRALRRLLPRLALEDIRALARAHGARPVHGAPHALLEHPYHRLLDAHWVRRAYAGLASDARALLDAALAEAGELSAQAILELEREPTRIQVGGQPVLPRHSRAFVLARLGLLVSPPGWPWVVPEEVFAALTSEAHAVHAEQLSVLASRSEEDEPWATRVVRARPPGPAAAALLAALWARGGLREGVGVGRTALDRCARGLGVSPAAAPMLVAVGRAAGLPYGEARLHELGARLWRTWLTTSAWDESAAEPDAFRQRGVQEPPSAVLRAVRAALLDAVTRLPVHRFATRDEILATAIASARVGSAREALCATLLDVSMPNLGMLDVGEADGQRVLRASAALRRFWAGLAEAEVPEDPGPAAVPGVHRVRRDASMRGLRTLARVARFWLDDWGLACEIDAVELGMEAAQAGWSELVADLKGALREEEKTLRALAQPSTRLTWQPVQAAIHVPDAGLRQRLLDDRDASALWCLPDSRSAYLLVRPGAQRRAVERALRRYGVVVDDAAS